MTTDCFCRECTRFGWKEKKKDLTIDDDGLCKLQKANLTRDRVYLPLPYLKVLMEERVHRAGPTVLVAVDTLALTP